MKFLREQWLWVAGVLLAVGVAVGIYSFMTGKSQAGSDSRNRWFVCAETKKPFQKIIEVGMSIPVLSPFSGKETGYPAELCYWNKDGTIKSTPTYVLLNSYVGDNSPKFCPDCGRLVVGRNPGPVEGKPPPTREEYEQRHGAPHQ